MALQTTFAVHAGCPFLDDSDHAARSHISLCSLHNPNTKLVISTWPIEIHSETSVFKPKNIANLWAQLLSISIQNGHFWTYQDALKLHQEQSCDETEADDNVMGKTVLYLRHKIQKGLLPENGQPNKKDFPDMIVCMNQLEKLGDLSFNIIQSTKIHEVFKAISELEDIPGDDTFHFRNWGVALYERYREILEQGEPTSSPPASDTAHKPELDVRELFTTEDLIDPPGLCLTQLTSQQCAQIEKAAQACDPPLDRAVVELMCMLPQINSDPNSEHNKHEFFIGPLARLIQPWDKLPNLERGVYQAGPTIPPHMLQLTDQKFPGYGVNLYVDTKTGEGLELSDWGELQSGHPYVELKGKRRPIEELLQEWIDRLLSMKDVPSGGEDTLPYESRSIDYLSQKSLLQEYGWPAAFPLTPSSYASLIRRQADLFNETKDRYENHLNLNKQWARILREWHRKNRTYERPSLYKQKDQTIKFLDGAVKEALNHHVRKFEDRKFALLADVPLDPVYSGPVTLNSSVHVGDDWRVEITPDIIMDRFHDVIRNVSISNIGENIEVDKIKEVMEQAYENWKLREKGVYVPDWADEEDDDPTSDYEFVEEWDGVEGGDEEFEVDEEDEDLDFDLVMLVEDAGKDIEEVRRGLEGFQMAEL